MADKRPDGFLQRKIYRFHYRNSAIAHFFTYRVRPAAVLFIALIPVVWVLQPQATSGPLFQIRAGITVLLIISLIWTVMRKARVKVLRHLPRVATAGEPVSYQVELHNLGRKKLSGVKLLELPADTRPSYQLFTHSREPGEEKRNAFDRTLGYYRWEWIQRGLTLFRHTYSSSLPTVAKGTSISTELSLTPNKRGVIQLTDMRVCLPDPLGIFQRCRRTEASLDKLIILPRRYRLPDYHIPGNARFQLGGEAIAGVTGQSGDFTSVRDYAPGDPLRHIHWKSWARTGKAIVKEYEDTSFPRYGLLLDTSVPAEDADLFEEAVSVAASFVATVDTHESLLDCMFIGDTAHIFNATGGAPHIESILEILAGVHAEPDASFDTLQQKILRHQDALTACICIFTGWDEQRRDMVAKLQSAGLPLKVFSICRDLDSAHTTHAMFPAPVAVSWLRYKEVAEDLHLKVS